MDGDPFYIIPIRILEGQPTADKIALKLGTAIFCKEPTKVTPNVQILTMQRR